MRSGERSRRAVRAALLVMLSFGLAVGVSGCAPQGPAPGATPSPPLSAPAGTAPVLPTNEEALAIVEELYPRLLTAHGKFMQDAVTIEELKLVATEDMVAVIEKSLADGNAQGYTVSGTPTADTMSVQQIQELGGAIEITFYACFDRTSYVPLDASGQPVLSGDARLRIPVEARVDTSEGDYKVDGYTPWSGENFC